MKWLALLLIVSGCASKVRTVGTKMISPEAQGGLGKGSVDFRMQGSQSDQLDFSKGETTSSLKNSTNVYGPNLTGEVGLLERLDVYLLLGTMNSPSLWGAKFQFIGEPRATASKGNWSASVLANVGESQKEEETSIGGDVVDKIDYAHFHADAGLVVGYRTGSKTLTYVSAVYYQEKLSGNVTTDDKTLDDDAFNYRKYGHLLNWGWIFYFGKSGHFKLDYGYQNGLWQHSASRTSHTINSAIGFFW